MLIVRGLIDSGFRGEICIIVINLDKEKMTLKYVEAIKYASLLYKKLKLLILKIVQDLDETSRGEGGFGSTGN